MKTLHLSRWRPAAIAIAACLWGAQLPAIAHAQPSPPTERLRTQEPVQYVGPDTYLLLDAEGRPQPVLGMTYEEFVAAWKKLQNLEPKTSEARYTIEQMLIDGKARDGHAECEVQITVRLLTDATIKIPLGMASAILRELPEWEAAPQTDDDATDADGSRTIPDRGSAPSQSFIEYDPALGGFVAGIQGQRDEQRRLSLKMLFPLVRDGNETSLRLNCPRALVGKLLLQLPTSVVEATVTDGSLVSQQTMEVGGTQLAVEGLAGDFQLTWSTADPQRTELSTVLSAMGSVLISIDGHSVRSEAELTVRSYGGSFDRFRVRLPPGAKLIQGRRGEVGSEPPGYRITVEEPTAPSIDTAAGNPEPQQVVLVELREKQHGPIEIHLSTEQPLGFPGAEPAVELAGFEVLGAVRQFGDVALQVADDWQTRLELGPYVRQVDPADLEPGLETANLRAAFQYDRQPWSLRARILARPFRVHVTPDFNLTLGPDEARLHVRLNYQIPGARAFEFRIQLHGWELTPDLIESNGLVDRDGVIVTRNGMLILPLTQATSRRAEVSFWLRRDLRRDRDEIEFPLPMPEADSVAAAELTVLANAGIELSPDLSHARGLSPTPVTDETPLPDFDDGRQVFRFRTYLPDAVFAAKVAIRPSDVSCRLDTHVSIDQRQLRAVQTIHYHVRYQPVDHVVVDVPEGWSFADGHAELGPVVRNDENVAFEASTSRSDERTAVPVEIRGSPDRQATRQARIVFPQSRMGRFDIRLSYDISQPAVPLRQGPLQLELPRPASGGIAGHRVIVTSSRDLLVTLDATASGDSRESFVVGNLAAGDKQSLELSARGSPVQLPLMVQAVSMDHIQPTKIDRVWLQTWQAGSAIQDRAAFQFRATAAQVAVELPPTVASDQVEVLVDGQLARVSAREEGRLLVDLFESQSAEGVETRAHTLELRYRRPGQTGLVVRQEFTPPQMIGMSTLSEVYWHLVLPGDVHIVRSPAQLAAVDRWQWFDIFWGRQPIKSQSDLETWVGATNQSAPAATFNEYLFSGVASVASVDVTTAPRWLIVLAASGAVLAVAALWMYVPTIRRGWIGLMMAVSIAALAIAYPTPAVLLGQASLIGWALATLAMVIRGWRAHPPLPVPSAPGSTNLRIRLPSRSDSMITPQLSSTGSGTPTAPLSVSDFDR